MARARKDDAVNALVMVNREKNGWLCSSSQLFGIQTTGFCWLVHMRPLAA
jgi:hypothetical protein